MAEQTTLEATPREVLGKQVKSLRRDGILPAILYGANVEPTPIQLNALDAARVLSGVSASTLIDLNINGETHKVLLRDIQRHVIKRHMTHVDFLQVAMDVTIRTSVPIELTGIAPASLEQGGILVPGVNEIEVEALPGDLPDRITVDISVLEEIDQSITVGELQIGANVRVLTDPDENVAHVIFQAEEEEEEEEELEEVFEIAEEPELVDQRGREEDEVPEPEEDEEE